jgi:acyl-CoA reductase-like NAD-dependent aldehyde dehydrogenase
MSATIEHTAALTRQQRTHVALAKEMGRDDVLAVIAPQPSELYVRLRSLANTQRRLAAEYASEAKDGGKYAERDLAEAKRLRDHARWYLGWARREKDRT